MIEMFYVTHWNETGSGLLIVDGVAPTRETAEGLRDFLKEYYAYPVEMNIEERGLPRGYRVHFREAAWRDMNRIRTHSVVP